jgi:hypothetical protein
LHLSDAHFGSKSHWGGSNPRETARVYLKEAGSALKSYGLLEDGGGFDAVVLSGDCTWGPDAHVADADHRRGFEVMRHFLDLLVRDEKWVPSAEHVIIVPGNHDVLWGAIDPVSKCRLFLRRREAEERYRDMLRAAFNDSRREHPHLSYCATARKGASTFVILGLNSTRIERPETGGIGYIGDDQLTAIAASAALSTTTPATLVAVLHHHLHANSVGLEELARFPEEHRSTFVVDSNNLTATLSGAGTALTLHGHLHQQFGWAYWLPGYNPMAICGAGSIGLSVESKQIFAPHQFQVLEVRSEEVRCHSLFAELAPRGTTRNWKYEQLPPFRSPSAPQPGNPPDLDKLIDDRKAQRSRTEIMLFESCGLYDDILRGNAGAKDFLKERVRKFYTRFAAYGAADFDSVFTAALDRLLSEYPAGRAQELHRRIFEDQMALWVLVWRCYFPVPR